MIQVHCWVYRSMYIIQRHYDVIATSGRVVPCPSSGPTGPEEDHPTYQDNVQWPQGTGCTGFGGGFEDHPAEDEWYAWYDGVRFRCRRVDDNSGGNVILCTVDEA